MSDQAHTHRQGAYSELAAAVYLLKQGYEVFRNLSPCGPVDLVAIRDDEILQIDVKSTRIYRHWRGPDGAKATNHDRRFSVQPSKKRTKAQIRRGVRILYVVGDVCGFSIEELLANGAVIAPKDET